MRVIREKVDDNNVRIGSLTQEVESLRTSIQQMHPVHDGDRRSERAARWPRHDAAGAGRRHSPHRAAAPAAIAASPHAGLSTRRYGDYTAGQ